MVSEGTRQHRARAFLTHLRVVNSDEGWEIGHRNETTNELMWDPNQYPSGMPAFAARLASAGIRLGLYGAASGVTCGDPGS